MSRLEHLVSLAMAGGAVALSTAASAEAIVVRSTGPSAPSYPVGRRLPATERVVLRADDRVVLVGEGPTRTLSGPGNFTVRGTGQHGGRRIASLVDYLSTVGASISRIAGTRGPDDGPSPSPNLWVMNTEQGGNFCVADIANVTMWRADMRQDALLTIVDIANPLASSPLAFIAGQNFRRWPIETMPIADGKTYRISGAGMAVPIDVRFFALDAAPTAEPEAIATTLADKGCIGQLAQLGERLAETETGR